MSTSFPVGSSVVVQNLVKGAQYNGTKGTIKSTLDPKSSRQEVFIPSANKTLAIKPVNLRRETNNSILAEYGQRDKLRDVTGPDWFEQNEMKSRQKYDESGGDDDFEDDFEEPPPKKRAATTKKTTSKKPKKPKYTEDDSDSDSDFMGSSQAASKPRSRATSSRAARSTKKPKYNEDFMGS